MFSMVIERISPNSALLNVCSSFILFYASLSFASPFKAFQHCFLCKLCIIPGTAVGINLSCAASVKLPVNRTDMHAECVRNIRQGCTCVVLFLKMFPILIGKIFASDKVSLLSVFRPKIMCERQ